MNDTHHDTKTCDRCGDEYEGYLIIVEDNFPAIVEYLRPRHEFENLCKPCRAALHPQGQAFIGENEGIEPKHEVPANDC